MAAVYALEPDVALAIDVTYATDVPGGDPARYGKIELGSGATITRGPIINRHVFELLVAAAEEEQIPHAVEVFTRRTGTDADDVHKSRGGVPTGIVSIPLRYMHTPGRARLARRPRGRRSPSSSRSPGASRPQTSFLR